MSDSGSDDVTDGSAPSEGEAFTFIEAGMDSVWGACSRLTVEAYHTAEELLKAGGKVRSLTYAPKDAEPEQEQFEYKEIASLELTEDGRPIKLALIKPQVRPLETVPESSRFSEKKKAAHEAAIEQNRKIKAFNDARLMQLAAISAGNVAIPMLYFFPRKEGIVDCYTIQNGDAVTKESLHTTREDDKNRVSVEIIDALNTVLGNQETEIKDDKQRAVLLRASLKYQEMAEAFSEHKVTPEAVVDWFLGHAEVEDAVLVKKWPNGEWQGLHKEDLTFVVGHILAHYFDPEIAEHSGFFERFEALVKTIEEETVSKRLSDNTFGKYGDKNDVFELIARFIEEGHENYTLDTVTPIGPIFRLFANQRQQVGQRQNLAKVLGLAEQLQERLGAFDSIQVAILERGSQLTAGEPKDVKSKKYPKYSLRIVKQDDADRGAGAYRLIIQGRPDQAVEAPYATLGQWLCNPASGSMKSMAESEGYQLERTEKQRADDLREIYDLLELIEAQL